MAVVYTFTCDKPGCYMIFTVKSSSEKIAWTHASKNGWDWDKNKGDLCHLCSGKTVECPD